MRAVDIIARKRDAMTLTAEEIDHLKVLFGKLIRGGAKVMDIPSLDDIVIGELGRFGKGAYIPDGGKGLDIRDDSVHGGEGDAGAGVCASVVAVAPHRSSLLGFFPCDVGDRFAVDLYPHGFLFFQSTGGETFC